MARDGNGNRNGRMDLNLHLGLPCFSHRRGSDLGSDLALGSSLALLSEEIRMSREMSLAEGLGSAEGTSRAPYLSEPSDIQALHIHQNQQNENNSHTSALSSSSAPHHHFRERILPEISLDLRATNLSQNRQNEHNNYASTTFLPPTESNHNNDFEDFIPISSPDSHFPDSPSYCPPSAAQGSNIPYDSSPYDLYPRLLPYSEVTINSGTEFHEPDSILNGQFASYQHSTHARRLLSAMASQPELIQYTEHRLQRLIDFSRGWHITRLSSRLTDVNESESNENSTERNHDSTNLEQYLGNLGNGKVSSSENPVSSQIEKKMDDNCSMTANFDCNVCLDVAKDPVVTSCGHLFCWPCLYQWLNIHSDHKECPVCKGAVSESNITPIYGRGSSTPEPDKNNEEGDGSLKIPPRPSGCRLESFNQRCRRLEDLNQRIRRPLSRRAGEEIHSWIRFVDEEIRNGNQDGAVDGTSDSASWRILTRLRANLEGDGSSRNIDHGLGLGRGRPSLGSTSAASSSQNFSSPVNGFYGDSRTAAILRDGVHLWNPNFFQTIPITTERLDALTTQISSVVERGANANSSFSAPFPTNPQNIDPSVTPQVQAPLTETQAADQVSGSSTMAMIQGDTNLPQSSVERSSVGSSPALRRRRNGASSSLDIDGEIHHARKRRRIN